MIIDRMMPTKRRVRDLAVPEVLLLEPDSALAGSLAKDDFHKKSRQNAAAR